MEKNLDAVSLPDSEEADAHAVQPHMEKQTFHRGGISLPVDNLTGIHLSTQHVPCKGGFFILIEFCAQVHA